jgi:hypothetical protein
LDGTEGVGHRIVGRHQQVVADGEGGMDDHVGLVGGRLLAGDVLHGHQSQLAAEDLLVAGERIPAVAAEEQVRTNVGGGKPGLPRDVRIDLELLDERRFRNGVVHLRYGTA